MGWIFVPYAWINDGQGNGVGIDASWIYANLGDTNLVLPATQNGVSGFLIYSADSNHNDVPDVIEQGGGIGVGASQGHVGV